MNTLPGDVVELWDIRWPDWLERIVEFRRLLDRAEQAVAAAFHFERDRQRYEVSHGALRLILARYCNTSPESLPFGREPGGKPLLVFEKGTPSLEFNLSHSGDRILIAVGGSRPVGVDVEQVKDDFKPMEIAARFFSAREVRVLEALPLVQQRLAFFRIWTRKEAFVKARGEGLLLPLAEFDVSAEPECASALCATRFDPAECERWAVADVSMPPGYAGAVAVAGSGWTLTRREFFL